MKQKVSEKLSFIGIFIGIGILLVSLGGLVLLQQTHHVFAEKTVKTDEPISIETPIIMVPGTNGTIERFDGLIEALGKTDVLKVTVATDGTVTSIGNQKSSTENPIIVIAFEDSSDDTLDSQGQWYQLALDYIQKYYVFDTYNYLGHSNGGLVIASYLENYTQPTDPAVNKVITLGTPYNDISETYNETTTTFSQVKETSELLEGYLQKNESISNTIELVNIAGEIEDTASDGIVPVQSVFSGRYIYQDQVASYKEILLQGADTEHSELVENQEVIQILESFFWDTEESANA